MDESRYYILKLISSAIVSSAAYLFWVIAGKKFDVFEMVTAIFFLYLGNIAVDSLSKKFDKILKKKS